jgi:hypothetical protein
VSGAPTILNQNMRVGVDWLADALRGTRSGQQEQRASLWVWLVGGFSGGCGDSRAFLIDPSRHARAYVPIAGPWPWPGALRRTLDDVGRHQHHHRSLATENGSKIHPSRGKEHAMEGRMVGAPGRLWASSLLKPPHTPSALDAKNAFRGAHNVRGRCGNSERVGIRHIQKIRFATECLPATNLNRFGMQF